MMLTFHTGRRGDLFSVVAHIKFLPLPKQLETRSGATQTSGWRSWRKQIPALEMTFRWMTRSFAGPYLCQLAAHPPLALVNHLLFFYSRFLEWIFYSTNSQLVYFMIDVVNSYFDRYSLSKVTHLVVEQPPLHIVRDNPGLSDKYFNPGESNRTPLEFHRNR